MKLKSTGIALLAAIGICVQAASQQPSTAPVYNVELIVFRATTALGGAENWSVQAADNLDTSGEPMNGAAPAARSGRFVGFLPSSQFQLTGLAEKLRASGTYVPVAHVGWSQTASAWGARAGFPVQKLGIHVEGLSGTIFLERGQYLHLGMALTYAMPTPPGGLGAGPGTVFTLNDINRVRFYERNYYDHPAFGVIALITPAQRRPAGR